MCNDCLFWSEYDYEQLAKRVLRLSDRQIARLFKKIGLSLDTSRLRISNKSSDDMQITSHINELFIDIASKEKILMVLNSIEKEN